MIVGLLIFIVLILLFGAGVVKGWLANIFGAFLGLGLLIAAAIWVNIQFGEYGLIGVCFALLVLFFAAYAWVHSEPT